jgi:hypothetical protein
MTFSKEDRLISELKEANREKFKVLTDIINNELIINKDLKNKIKTI